jgi:hypothetical protein
MVQRFSQLDDPDKLMGAKHNVKRNAFQLFLVSKAFSGSSTLKFVKEPQ